MHTEASAEAIEKQLTTYATIQHPIIVVPNSNWVVIGYTVDPRSHQTTSYDVHYNEDDPNHQFKTAADFHSFPDAIKLANHYNAPFTKQNRMLLRRSLSHNDLTETLMDNHYRAAAYLELQQLIDSDPGLRHFCVKTSDYIIGYYKEN